MDKIKSLLSPGSKKDNEAMYDTSSGQQATGASGKLTGEGSHFGTGGTGTDSAGYSLGKDTEGHGFSAAEPTGNTDSSGYAIANNPEALGTRDEDNHINVVPTEQDTGLGESDSTGRAAIGPTSTYSSHPLATGDKTSSVVSPSSSDANTFRRPEASSSTGVAGVGPGAAETAARRAYDPSSDHMPGGFPGEESSNPYAASSLDPRVDSAGHAPVHQSHTGRDAALGAGAGAAGVGAYEATKHHEPSSSTTAPSTLTSTTNPTERSPAYETASGNQGLDSTTPATGSSFTPATTSETVADNSTQKKSMVGTVLGALGLGGGAATAKHEHDKHSAVDSTPSTTTGVGSYETPSQSGPPPSHHRKESIPTTAYPAGNLDSVRPISGPTGQVSSQDSSDHHYGRDAAVGAGALGAAGLGAHEYEKSRQPTSDTTFASGMAGTSSAAPNTSTVHDIVTQSTPQTSQTSSYPSTSQSGATTSGAGTGLAATAGTTGATVPGAGDDSHHYGRDTAIGGAALGAAGLGAHEYEKSRQPIPEAAGTSQYSSQGQSGITPTSQQYGNQPITQDTTGTAGTQEPSHHYGRDAAMGGGALGATAIGAHEYEKSRQPTSGTAATSEYPQQGISGVTPTSQQYGNQPITQDTTGTAAGQEPSHHYGRDAAVGAGALGAAGLGAHEYEKNKTPATGTTGLTPSSQQYGNQPISSQGNQTFSDRVDPRSDASGNANRDAGVGAMPATTAAQSENQHHYGRDAAIVGGGAAAAGYGAHETSEHDAEKAEKERSKLQKSQTREIEKEQKAHEKEIKKEQKAEEKAEKKQEKELAKEEKKQEKELVKEEKKQEKIAAKEEKQQEKIAAKEEKQQEKALEKDEKRHEKEGAAAVGAGAVGAGGVYEYEKHHPSTQPSTGVSGGGLSAADAADKEAYNKQNRYTATMADPGLDSTVRKPTSAVGEGTDPHYGRDAALGGAGAGALGTGAYEAEKHHESSQIPSSTTTSGAQGTDPYYSRHQVPDSAIAGEQTTSNVGTDGQTHYGRNAALGGAGVAAVGGGAYEAEKHIDQGSTGTGHPHSGLAAADEDDKRAYGHQEAKKPSLFRRIFKRKKNEHTGEMEDDENDYEDVAHDHHQEGDLTKPSYNPFKKEDPNVKPVEGRI